MGYVPLNNYKYDSGYKRIQSGPDHEGYVVLYSGVQSTGADEGIVVAGAPLSGTLALGAWDYDANWRYVPSTLSSQSGVLNPTPYNVSGALGTYDATRIFTRNTVAGAQIASAIGPEAGAVTPRGGALQPGSNVTQPERYMYYGGAAPDNQNYSPYNTPDANSAAEGKTGGGVTHKTFESSLLTNVLGSQGTSDRSQWRYHQPVYCKTYTETKRSDVPGLMSTPLRAVYRGGSTSYNYNYGGELLVNRGGFELLPPDDQVLGCPFPVSCPTTDGLTYFLTPGDTLTASPPCTYVSIRWYNSLSSLTSVGEGLSYVIQESDINTRLYFVVTYPDNSTDASNLTCFDIVYPNINRNWFLLEYTQTYSLSVGLTNGSPAVFDSNGDMWLDQRYSDCNSANIHKVTTNATLNWSFEYKPDPSENSFSDRDGQGRTFIVDGDSNTLEIFYQRFAVNPSTGFPIQPTKIYKFTVDKATGIVISTRTIVYSPINTNVYGTSIINVVKINSNYYIMQEIYDISQFNVCIFKFDTNLNLIWSKRLTTLGTSLLPSDFRENNGQLIGSAYFTGFTQRPASLFSLNLDGNTYNILPTIITRVGVYTNQEPVGVRSMDRDTNGNFYAVGGFEGTITIGGLFARIIVFKQSSAGVLLWASDLWPSLLAKVIIVERQLLVINNKLVFAGAIEASATVPPTYNVAIAILDLTTGLIETIMRIRHDRAGSGNIGQIGQGLQLNRMSQPTGFVVQTAMGYRFRFDLNNLPTAGTYSFTDTTGAYIVTSVTPVQQSRLTELQADIGSVANFSFVNTTLSSYFSVNTTISGVPYPPSGTVSIKRTAVV